MRNKLGILLIIFMLNLMAVPFIYAQIAGTPGSDNIGDDFYEGLGNGGYDTLHYDIDINVVVLANYVDGIATIQAQATQDLSAFNLDFSGFIIDKVLVDGEPAVYSRDEREMTITPSEPIAEGTDFEITVTYAGIPEQPDRLLFSGGWTPYRGGIYVASEPAGAAQWYPVNDHPLDKATYSVRVTVPEPYVVASNGTLQEVIEQEQTRTYVTR